MNDARSYTNLLIQQYQKKKATVQYPQIIGLSETETQIKLNKAIEDKVFSLMAENGIKRKDLEEMSGLFEVKLNQDEWLSIVFTNYAYWTNAAHGLTLQASITMNVKTGVIYELGDLFKKGSYYKTRISPLIKKQFKEYQFPLIQPYQSVKDTDGFYLTKSGLVIYYQSYEYTPYYVGIPEFTIPYNTIAAILKPEVLIR
ncbi:DUF3298 and DUF4163 domain-containing protein [Fictibacillus terranigra]|uniref:DUF3298 and DUF4163 domain-containing protein n=1 Tax=Fictibacillus terranigra TaxID=3058424 RepID=A0ABT8E0P2_9BACL|nr:DUF3298 and DUF4163 domain-containing protein [Fictibacillus sp. CENA-BCM004]MDN4071489.1 DUF3298 and DUF4163 domain-containing protein [Fictibacillus sp. CENA-BCM004]